MGGLDGIRCVVCRERIVGDSNHHCDPKRERQIENARKSHDRSAIRQRQPEFRERLSVGFEMLAMAGDTEQ